MLEIRTSIVGELSRHAAPDIRGLRSGAARVAPGGAWSRRRCAPQSGEEGRAAASPHLGGPTGGGLSSPGLQPRRITGSRSRTWGSSHFLWAKIASFTATTPPHPTHFGGNFSQWFQYAGCGRISSLCRPPGATPLRGPSPARQSLPNRRRDLRKPTRGPY